VTVPRWSLVIREGLTILQASAFAAVDGVAHAFSTRRADDGEFDVGPATAAGPPWDGRRERLARAAGLGGRRLLAPLQVHGDRAVTAAAFGAEPPAADAVVALRRDERSAAPAVRTADCLPVLLAARDGRAVAAVHAGWRGTAAGVVAAAVRQLAAAGIEPGGLLAALGPAIGPCCYEVGTEVVDAVARAAGVDRAAVSHAEGPERAKLDLAAANRLLLERSGLDPAAIETAPWCTRCRPDLFWSWRREGPTAGRMLACIGWADSGAPSVRPGLP
jgi:YfiH family protein